MVDNFLRCGDGVLFSSKNIFKKENDKRKIATEVGGLSSNGSNNKTLRVAIVVNKLGHIKRDYAVKCKEILKQ